MLHKIFRIPVAPQKKLSSALTAIVFIVFIAGYSAISHIRHEENPADKLAPSIAKITSAFIDAAIPDKLFDDIKNNGIRFGMHRFLEESQLLLDTKASGIRFGISLLIILLAIPLGLHMGLLPIVERMLYSFVVFFDKIPALSVLPILFIVLGFEEVAKISLIVIGVFPTIVLDTYLRTKNVPKEQIISGFTQGASNPEIAYRIVLPQILPHVLDTIRLNLKSMILFLIAGESLAATVGLGYRIFVVRRFLQMDTIIAYVLWMSFLMFFADIVMRLWVAKKYPWLNKE